MFVAFTQGGAQIEVKEAQLVSYKESRMYGKGLGVTNVATGISLLTPHHNHVLFVIGATLLVSGIAIFAVSFVLSRRQAVAK